MGGRGFPITLVLFLPFLSLHLGLFGITPGFFVFSINKPRGASPVYDDMYTFLLVTNFGGR
jgi:hypothetical protein